MTPKQNEPTDLVVDIEKFSPSLVLKLLRVVECAERLQREVPGFVIGQLLQDVYAAIADLQEKK